MKLLAWLFFKFTGPEGGDKKSLDFGLYLWGRDDSSMPPPTNRNPGQGVSTWGSGVGMSYHFYHQTAFPWTDQRHTYKQKGNIRGKNNSNWKFNFCLLLFLTQYCLDWNQVSFTLVNVFYISLSNVVQKNQWKGSNGKRFVKQIKTPIV